MKKHIVFGLLGGLGVAMFLSYQRQKAAWAPQSVPIGNLFQVEKPDFFIPVILGGIVGYATSL